MWMNLSARYILFKDTKRIALKKGNKAPAMLLKVFLFGSYAIEMENDVNLDHQSLSKYRHVILKLFVKTEGTGFPNKDRTRLVYNIFVFSLNWKVLVIMGRSSIN